MIRSAIFSWAAFLLLAGVLAGYLEYAGFAETAMELAAAALIAGMLVQVLRTAVDVVRQSRPPQP